MTQVAVSKSFVAHSELSRILEEHYALSNVRCQLITATMRDAYLVTSDHGRYIFMVYRHGQHTADEVAAEWQFVDYLAVNDVSVAPAVRTRDGAYVVTLHAPEGTRYGVLSTFVEGEHLRRRPSAKAVQTYGRIIGQIHLLADEMPFPLNRPERKISAIIQQSIAAFEAEVLDRRDDLAYLRDCGAILTAMVEKLSREKPGYGTIHGDVIRTNALVSDEGKVTVIDFELCGPGWRAYDVASYLHTIRGTAEEREFEQAFLSGYSEVRSLTASEQRILPVFEAVRAIFSIGTPAMNIYHWGSVYFYAFVDGSLDRLKRSMAQIHMQKGWV